MELQELQQGTPGTPTGRNSQEDLQQQQGELLELQQGNSTAVRGLMSVPVTTVPAAGVDVCPGFVPVLPRYLTLPLRFLQQVSLTVALPVTADEVHSLVYLQ
jgi:hypothetical protein